MKETEIKLQPGWAGLCVTFSLVAAVIIFAINASGSGWAVLLLILSIIATLISLAGFKINSPNNARVVQLFGTYVGTLKEVGFFWGNPFYNTTLVSQRIRTFETDVDKTEEVKDAAGTVVRPSASTRKPLKVNDKDGTPIEIAAVVVWKVISPTDAVFEVDDYEDYVKVQADAALRSLASCYSYDAPEAEAHSLRGHIAEVGGQLRKELQERMHQAGVDVLEARISKLAYAPEIAAAMLQRQQAGAVIAARARIVEGAVSMVEHALEMLKERNVVDLDPERKAAMVSNLLVVLCSHNSPQPVLNTGTLHN